MAAEDGDRWADKAGTYVEQAVGVGWYEQQGNDADLAAFVLCRLRRARAGERGSPQHGDEAVRAVLAKADPDAVVWIASRAISYLDEHGFPEAVEPWAAEVERSTLPAPEQEG